MSEDINEMRPEFLGLHAVNPFALFNSSSRGAMFASQFSQKLTLNNPDEPTVVAGPEMELAKTTFSTKMPEDGKIIKIIPRYPKGIGQGSIEFNPETLVIYEKERNKEIDYFTVAHHTSYHQVFGFSNVKKGDTINRLKPGAFFRKDEIFTDSPGVSDSGCYCSGLSLNVAFMSHPAVSEDGVIVSRDVLDKFKTKVYDKRVVEVGSRYFPLNAYGNPDSYKAFPEIGEYLRNDGILMMLRKYDSDVVPVNMSRFDVMEPDFLFDTPVFVRGGKGRVVDIKVYKSNSPISNLPTGMNGQMEKYHQALLAFHQEIVATEKSLRQERYKIFGTDALQLSPRLSNLVIRSMAIIGERIKYAKDKPDPNRQTLNLLYRKDPIDEYRIEFIIEYDIVPSLGYKLTDMHGGKGVIVKIMEPHEMPIRPDGVRADIIMDGASTGHRMNLGRLYEHYISGSAQDNTMRLRQMWFGSPEKPKRALSLEVVMSEPNKFKTCFDFLLGLYQITNYKLYTHLNNLSEEEKADYLAYTLSNKVQYYIPIDTQKELNKMVEELETYSPSVYTPIQYIGNSGRQVTTKMKIRIAPMQIMLLEKIADDWSAVASAKSQHFGILSPQIKSEKFTYPYRNTPVRFIDETFGRILAGYTGPEAVAEMMDRSNNPQTRRNLYWNIISAETPTNIESAVDRNMIPLGHARPIQLIRSVLKCAGIDPTYEEESNAV